MSAVVAAALLAICAPQRTAALTNAKLNGPFLPIDGDVTSFQISPDGTRVVYLADQDINGVTELYSRPIDGSAAPVKLNGPPVVRGSVGSFLISSDSTRVVYRADQDTDGHFELYSRPIDGSGSATKLNGSLISGSVQTDFLISADSTRVAYRATQDTIGMTELYSRPTDGSGSSTKLNGTITVPGGDVTSFLITADSTHVAYRADQDTTLVFEIYSRTIDGSGSAVKLNGPLVSSSVSAFQASPDSTRVVYAAAQDAVGVVELYARPIDGSGSPIKLNGTLVTSGDVQLDFLISPDSTRVVYRADQDTNDVFEIYSRPIDGSGSAVKLSGPMVTPGDAISFQISPDSTRVIYLADQDQNALTELYSRPIDGSGAVVKLNDPITRSLISFRIAPNSARVLYLGRQNTNVDQIYSRAIDASGPSVKVNGGTRAVRGYLISNDSARVVYVSDQDTPLTDEIYSRAIDGSGSAVKMNGALVAGGDVRRTEFLISPDNARVVYRADQDTDNAFEIFSRPLDGSGTSVKLNGSLPIGGSVAEFLIAPDATRVAYMADQEVDGREEIYSRPIDGSGAPVKLSGVMAVSGSAVDFLISPDSSRVVYLAFQDSALLQELYVRPLDGSGASIKLNGPLAGSQVVAFQISPNSARAVYVADQDQDSVFELYSRLLSGSGAPVKLNPPFQSGSNIVNFRISPDSSRVVYLANQDSSSNELYSRPINGSGSAVKLNGVLPSNANVVDFLISADGSRVVYRANQDTQGVIELYSRRIDGSGAPVKLNGPLAGSAVVDFLLSPDGRRVVYRGDQDTDGVPELYSRSIDGSGSSVKLNGPLATGGNVADPDNQAVYLISPDGTHVVYRADQDTAGTLELYSRPIDGSGSAVKLNGLLVALGAVASPLSEGQPFRITADSQRVVYIADEDDEVIFELFTRPIDGSGSPVKLNGTLVTGDVYDFVISPDSTRVVYRADQETSSLELFSRAIDGSGSTTKENGPLVSGGDVGTFATGPGEFDIAVDGVHVVYLANQASFGDVELWSSTRCGDLTFDPGEQCDDGNMTAGDGCGATCQIEPRGRKCLRAIGRQGRALAVRRFRLMQSCLDRADRGVIACQANQCVLNTSIPPITVPGSTCTTATDCCPAFDRAVATSTTAAQGSVFAAKVGKAVRKACSLAKGTDGIRGNADDTYITPQALGFGSSCLDTFGQCSGISILQLDASGSSNDLLECTDCAAATLSAQLMTFEYPSGGVSAAEVTCERAIGLKTRKLNNQELVLRQKCFDRVHKGTLGCIAGRCVRNPRAAHPGIVSGSSCSSAADCCPLYDNPLPTRTTQMRITNAVANATLAAGKACSTDSGVDALKGTDDDTYIDPQNLGHGPLCLATFGQCDAVPISTMRAAGASNDLLDCVSCTAGSATDAYTRFLAGAR